MPFQYVDRGDHETYIPALQGGSFCRVHKLNRFFGGLDPLFPCLGSDYFRVDSQVYINSAGAMGPGLGSYFLNDGSTALSPVGIVEDENTEHGRYFALRYNGNVAQNALPVDLVVYNSEYEHELDSTTIAVAWTPPFSIPQGFERGMRVVNLGLVEGGDSSHRTFLYYLEPSASSTLVYALELPDEGEAASVIAPTLVTQLDFVAVSRFYVVPIGGDNVALYVGNRAKDAFRRTISFVHDPVTDVLSQTPSTLIEGSLPFPQSYAACVGKGDEVHLFLEPTSSWLEGAGTRAEDREDVTEQDQFNPPIPATIDRHSGNAWTLVTLSNGGTIIQGQIPFSGNDLQPWMGASDADAMGGRFRASVTPRFLARQAPPPEKFKAGWGNVPANDISFCYTLFGSVGLRTKSGELNELESEKFVQRELGTVSLAITYGNSRATSGVIFDEGPLVESVNFREAVNLLVPGSLLIEPLATQGIGEFSPLTTLGFIANRLDSWRLADDDAPYGADGDGTTTPPIPPEALSTFSTVSMAVGGAQAVWSARLNQAIIVGWFIGGIEPS